MKDNVTVIGIEYVNCSFAANGVTKTESKPLGSISTNCFELSINKTGLHQIAAGPVITFLSRQTVTGFSCSAATGKRSGILLIVQSGATKYWTWE